MRASVSFFGLRLRIQKKAARPTSKKTPSATPMPMPALAPELRPGDGGGAPDEVGREAGEVDAAAVAGTEGLVAVEAVEEGAL